MPLLDESDTVRFSVAGRVFGVLLGLLGLLLVWAMLYGRFDAHDPTVTVGAVVATTPTGLLFVMVGLDLLTGSVVSTPTAVRYLRLFRQRVFLRSEIESIYAADRVRGGVQRYVLLRLYSRNKPIILYPTGASPTFRRGRTRIEDALAIIRGDRWAEASQADGR